MLTVVAVGWLWGAARERRPPAWLGKVFLLLLMVQFAVPLTLLGSDQIFQRFLDTDYQSSRKAIDPLAKEAAKAVQPVPADVKQPSVFERLKDWFDKKSAGPAAEYQAIKEILENATKHVVKLIAVFVLQTIILPLLLLWALYGMTRALLRWPGDVRGSSTRPLL